MSDDTGSRRDAARDAYRKKVRNALKHSDEAFRGEYADAIAGLLALSEADVQAISPDPTCLETYDKLIAVVKEASRVNIAQAELRQQIVGLGNVAVAIARRIPRLSQLL